ncbi:MAG: protein-L-isoaspartate O-methyltransferase [Nanoarchaeota archaeon]|nr:protein-L-isoaspartate O-methyltransferase [Nanoarchaeota archaeon]
MNKQQLIESLKNQGFSEKILNAFRRVRREDFVPREFKESAYEDIPLPIGLGQTISQPYTIAFMLNLLELEKPNSKLKILEIGSGSGYVLALINEMSKDSEIYGIEIIKSLAEISKKRLKNNKNIKIISGDGSRGLKEYAPYDRILISASSSKIPEHLYSQLKATGIIVASVQDSILQIKKENDKITKKEFTGFAFVPLVED